MPAVQAASTPFTESSAAPERVGEEPEVEALAAGVSDFGLHAMAMRLSPQMDAMRIGTTPESRSGARVPTGAKLPRHGRFATTYPVSSPQRFGYGKNVCESVNDGFDSVNGIASLRHP